MEFIYFFPQLDKEKIKPDKHVCDNDGKSQDDIWEVDENN